jgi:Uma2 family endonuclease
MLSFTMKRDSLARVLPKYTYEDYKLWEGEWELIEGVPYAMAPSPFSNHQYAVAKILSQIIPQIEGCDKPCYVFSELDWILSEDTVVRPDVVVICEKVKDYIKSPPEVIFEVVSKKTVEKDEYLKFELYEREKVPFYVLVYPDLRKARIFGLKEDRYEKLADCVDHTFEFNAKCRFSIDFGKIWY